jgi:2-oxoglutarate ferredoxin oxidoreductase subunit beta
MAARRKSFLHSIRRNPNITVIVHNNMIYGLTKGQPPTTPMGMHADAGRQV